MWERFSYYGMRALLVLYMVKLLLLPGHAENVIGLTALKSFFESMFGPLGVQPFSSHIYGLYTGLVYLTPVFGGLLADRWIGRYWTIVGFSVPYVLGHFVLGFSDPIILGDVVKSVAPERLQFIANLLLFGSLALLTGMPGQSRRCNLHSGQAFHHLLSLRGRHFAHRQRGHLLHRG